MPMNSGPGSQAETTTRGSVVALRRDALPNPYVSRVRGAARASSPEQDSREQGAKQHATDERELQDQPHIASSHVVDAARPEEPKHDEGKGARTVTLPPLPADLPLEERPAVALEMGHKAFVDTGYWVSFYRAIFAPEGVIHRLFPAPDEREYFEQTPEFLELHKMMTALRTTDDAKIDAVEPQTMITIRLPRSLQATIIKEAKEHGVSTNKLCISKLLLPISPLFVPEEKGKIRGRKPGQQARHARVKAGKVSRKS